MSSRYEAGILNGTVLNAFTAPARGSIDALTAQTRAIEGAVPIWTPSSLSDMGKFETIIETFGIFLSLRSNKIPR